MQDNFLKYFLVWYMSLEHTLKSLLRFGLGHFSQYKTFYGLLDMHIFVNFSKVKMVSDILFSFSEITVT